MPHALLITVRFHIGRYHGQEDWPPSPARLFQALVAAAAVGGELPKDIRAALAWLEGLDPPVVAAPAVRNGQGYGNYVPNNDLDAKGGHPDAIIKEGKKKGPAISFIKAEKKIKPRLFNADKPLYYCWVFENDPGDYARAIIDAATRLYQLGRGVDMAWATAEILGVDEAEARLKAHGGARYRPARGGNGSEGALYPCPGQGSLESLERRFAAMGVRLQVRKAGRRTEHLFTQPPKPRFRLVPYDCPPVRALFDLRQQPEATSKTNPSSYPWPFTNAVKLVEAARDRAAAQLARAIPERKGEIERVFIGRNATPADKDQRIRIVPVPSIGHAHVTRAIRRLMVEIPPNCPLPVGDIDWAFSGLHLGMDPETGELVNENLPMLVTAESRSMLTHYGIGRDDTFRVWRTVTPAALPERAARRRIDPARQQEEAKGGAERAREEAAAATAVRQALRHAGIDSPVEAIRVQREPFHAKGARAEAFAPGTRFAKERLWHVEITFATPLAGPLVIGDGRYLGLGLMAPERGTRRDFFVFALPDGMAVPMEDAPALITAVRRALIALARDDGGAGMMLFSGHEADGAPARSGRHAHVFLAAHDADGDGRLDRVLIAAPWRADRTHHPRARHRDIFDRVVRRLETVRAGRLGVLGLTALPPLADEDALLGRGRVWESATPYRATRHARRNGDPAAAVTADLIAECGRRGLPRPRVEVLESSAGPRGGNLTARVRLSFATAVAGPLLLGRDSHKGGGLFRVQSR
jgi:CRISPR-associated protein Csb2